MTCVEIIQLLKDLAPVISAFMLLVVILLTGCWLNKGSNR